MPQNCLNLNTCIYYNNWYKKFGWVVLIMTYNINNIVEPLIIFTWNKLCENENTFDTP